MYKVLKQVFSTLLLLGLLLNCGGTTEVKDKEDTKEADSIEPIEIEKDTNTNTNTNTDTESNVTKILIENNATETLIKKDVEDVEDVEVVEVVEDVEVEEIFPIAVAGIDKKAFTKSNVYLDAKLSTGENLSYRWTILKKPLESMVSIVDENSSTALLVPDVEGEYQIQLIVHSATYSSKADTLDIEVKSSAQLSEEVLKFKVNALAPEGHVFQGHNQYSSNITFNGNIYVISFESDDRKYFGGRPYINKIAENNQSDIQTELLDKNEIDVYSRFDDPHHRFAMSIDKNGYIHIIGDMHHGAGGSSVGGSNRSTSDNPLPDRFHNAYGEQMYWISERPEDISAFRFIGDDADKHYTCNRTTYNYFIKDNDNELYLAGRHSVRENKSHESGTLGLCVAKYDSVLKKWTALGGIDAEDYGLKQDGDIFFSSLLWEPHGYNKSDTSQWYQNYVSKVKFDKNNRMHITSNINADTVHNNATHIIYAYSDNGGKTFFRLDGSALSTLPMRITDTPINIPSIVLTQNKEQPIFESYTPALFWDKDFSPAISYYNISNPDNRKTTYTFYDKYSQEWHKRDFAINVESIRTEQYPLSDGSMLIIGNRYQAHHKQSFNDFGTIYELTKTDRQSISADYLIREVDDKLLRERNILRGSSEINGTSAIITIEIPK